MEDLRPQRSEMQRPSAAASNLSASISDDLLHPQGFADVFGGPPRFIFSHQLSATGVFYDDIFRPPEKAAATPISRRGRNLPLFDIPAVKQGSRDRCSRQKNSFLSDIFSWEYSKKVMSSSRSRSRSNSSSVLSSEELSPLRPPVSDHGYDDVSLLGSKLRPINVNTKWNSERSAHEDDQKQQKSPLFSVKKPESESEPENEHQHLDKFWGCPFRSNQTKEIKESMDLERMNFRVSTNNDDVQFNSPSSVVSSDRNDETSEIIDGMDEDDDEDDLMSSYVIEIDSCNRGTSCESNDVDEAIAWAKEKFNQHGSQDKTAQEMVDESKGPMDIDSSLLVIADETSILDEKIRLWMTGKESDVRLLLSSLHHILWPNSGWIAIPLTKLLESAQVKKAYQKSVLCLHPDKLQQRGATLLHKYIAEKAFAALQDAWTAFGLLDASSR